jgi:hypothetical protein
MARGRQALGLWTPIERKLYGLLILVCLQAEAIARRSCLISCRKNTNVSDFLTTRTSTQAEDLRWAFYLGSPSPWMGAVVAVPTKLFSVVAVAGVVPVWGLAALEEHFAKERLAVVEPEAWPGHCHGHVAVVA